MIIHLLVSQRVQIVIRAKVQGHFGLSKLHVGLVSSVNRLRALQFDKVLLLLVDLQLDKFFYNLLGVLTGIE